CARSPCYYGSSPLDVW
nr:immunoglobulin heavy chain junction region [Mus musculus]